MITESDTNSLQNGEQENLKAKVAQVFNIFESTFKQYSPSEIFLSFNGGKDCTVLLHLVISYLRENLELQDENIHVIYIQPNNPFREIEDFVKSCEHKYTIEIKRVNGKLKNVLEQVCKEDPNLKATIMGCRRTDPHCENLETFQRTDPDWPSLLRINPLLDWSCKDIWDYIKTEKIPYCCLYDFGYTSIGDQMNTRKNPHLKYKNEVSGEVCYKPAYLLLDDKLERAGRV